LVEGRNGEQSYSKTEGQDNFKAELESKLDFAQIMNSAEQGMIMADQKWNIEYVNPAFARTVSRPIEENIGPMS
jgi:PAS domain-containing protein